MLIRRIKGNYEMWVRRAMYVVLEVIIADDDPIIAGFLKKVIEEVPDVRVIAVVNDGKEAVRLVDIHIPDVVFLDIDMPETNGIEAARQMAEIDRDIKFVFVTAHSDFALNAFELYSFDYIMKPFKETRVKTTVRKLKEKVFLEQSAKSKQPFGLMIEVDSKQVFLDPAEILFIESRKHKLLIKTINCDYLTAGDLFTYEQRLSPHNFFRCHKGYLVNLNQLKEVVPIGRTFEIVLRSGDKVLLSRSKEKALREKLK